MEEALEEQWDQAVEGVSRVFRLCVCVCAREYASRGRVLNTCCTCGHAHVTRLYLIVYVYRGRRIQTIARPLLPLYHTQPLPF